MANTFKVLFRGAATTGLTTRYTVPASTVTLVSSIVVANTATSAATFEVDLGGFLIANDVSIPANESLVLDVKQLLTAGQTLGVQASATTVNFSITGLEIT